MKYLKIRLLDKEGHNVFQDVKVDETPIKIAEVQLIEHKEVDTVLDICKGND